MLSLIPQLVYKVLYGNNKLPTTAFTCFASGKKSYCQICLVSDFLGTQNLYFKLLSSPMCSFRKYPMCRFIVSENTVSTDPSPKQGLLKIPSQGGTQTLIVLKESMNPNWIVPERTCHRVGGRGEKPKNFPTMEVGLDVFWNNTIA